MAETFQGSPSEEILSLCNVSLLGSFFSPFFSFKLNMKRVIHHIYLSRTHALLELAGFTGIPSRRASCKTGLGCACAHPLLSEAMDPGLTFWVRYNSGIMTDRRTKYKETKKGKKKKRSGEHDKKKGGDILPLPLKWLQIYQINSERKNYGQPQGQRQSG